jgi:hypothetical protein
VQTRNRMRDQHLRSADFFDAESHPHVQFLSDSVVLSDDALEVHGRLSARGRSIPLELKAQDPPSRRGSRDRSGRHRATPPAGDDLQAPGDDPAAHRTARQRLRDPRSVTHTFNPRAVAGHVTLSRDEECRR